ncbi:LOW QUALITY PROTEIN: L-glutamine:2-deoxy-scyllo-inosose aminotransferase-like [Amphiura filiformis]|uniref:LOW QUALITY PROTEIN: L-glutamine:2-deoxy-scyllo-inosose aminotransferase-like n=1 Tax=Amphiura filiformis TaxID=82378 RepID=UPI003B20BA88
MEFRLLRNQVYGSMESTHGHKFGLTPYACLYIDASWADCMYAVASSLRPNTNHEHNIKQLCALWNSQQSQPHQVIPCLSVRTGLDLFFRVKRYPLGSEIIMSAINIPDMVRIIEHHGLKVVPCDINLETLAPKLDMLETLISVNTVAIVIKHIYGRVSNIDGLVEIAKKHNLVVIEDNAEVFCGLKYLGHPKADMSLYSFGVIKPITAFGGAMVRVNDPKLYQDMHNLYQQYSIQEHAVYLKKVMKYVAVKSLLNSSSAMYIAVPLARHYKFDYKEAFVNKLRGFPGDLIVKIRQRPSAALLHTMHRRLKNFDEAAFQTNTSKGMYVSERLPSAVEHIGMKTDIRNYWLFPVVVHEPEQVIKELNKLGVEAYRGATQLNLVYPTQQPNRCPSPPPASQNAPGQEFADNHPHEAHYLIDHVIYLPVHKHVPQYYLDQICLAVEVALRRVAAKPFPKIVVIDGKTVVLHNGEMKVKSKL